MRKIVKEMFGELNLWGKVWLSLGFATLVAAGLMSFDFGLSVSWKHALFLACLSVITAFAPEAAYRQFQRGHKLTALGITLACAPWFAIEFYSHAGYTAGLRGSNISEAHVQNASWTGAQEAVADDKTNRELWIKQLSDLRAQNAWAGTVTPDGLKAQVATAQKAIDLETARGGCKAKCLKLMESKADLEKRISTAEQASDLTRRIEATQRILDKKREAATATQYKQSTVEHQNQAVVKWVALAINGTTEASPIQAESAQQAASFAMAFAGTMLPGFAIFMAGLYRKDEDHLPPTAAAVTATTLAPKAVGKLGDYAETFKAAYTRACDAKHGVEPLRLSV